MSERAMRVRWPSFAVVLLTAAALIAPFLVVVPPGPLRDRHSQPSLPAAAARTVSDVVVTESGKLFHSARCPFVHGRSVVEEVAVAEAQGYSPCPRCLGAWRAARP
jgi:hypothetical protein